MTIHQATHAVVRWFAIVTLLAFITLGVWDLWLIKKGQLGGGNSASAVITEVVRANVHWALLFAFMAGVLFGHWFWNQKVAP